VTGNGGTTGVVGLTGTGLALGRVGCVGLGFGFDFDFDISFFGASTASGITVASRDASAIPESMIGVAGVVGGDSSLQPKRTATTTAKTRSARIAANACLIDTWKRCHVRSRITSRMNESSCRMPANFALTFARISSTVTSSPRLRPELLARAFGRPSRRRREDRIGGRDLGLPDLRVDARKHRELEVTERSRRRWCDLPAIACHAYRRAPSNGSAIGLQSSSTSAA
jgi:hypothetical protein